ncbi:ABC transporter ATP-binding protein [Neoroseomonas lacus]|uniref:ABC transporter ATP-binding protein n=1 Tax=Neoroseomonas lacus TaxID=287609 RepID=A0A917NK76_9PROT|nr:ABC transporter ATP-binding protein [Neoroseomonas lacus]GGJ03961.1 ABC transporter ATP-binding protein [Neoroseomonas lacus]
MVDTVLDVTGLRAGYGPAEVLFGVDLTLARGEVAALMGRNGAGKSTTLKAIMGLLTPRAGTVRFAGQEIAGMAPYRIARLGLGYVPEERRIFTDLTVMENLAVGRRAAPPGREAWTPERLFAFFPNLAEMRHRRAGAMSGGEQQMLTIARTLMGNPEAVLLDEPSEGLAPVIVEQMADAVLRMKDEGLAVLVSEQNLDFAAAVADRALILEKGTVRWQGDIATLEADEDIRRAYLTV